MLCNFRSCVCVCDVCVYVVCVVCVVCVCVCVRARVRACIWASFAPFRAHVFIFEDVRECLSV